MEDAGHVHRRGFIGKMRNTVNVVQPLIYRPSRQEMETLIQCTLIISGEQSNWILSLCTLTFGKHRRSASLSLNKQCGTTQVLQETCPFTVLRNVLAVWLLLCRPLLYSCVHRVIFEQVGLFCQGLLLHCRGALMHTMKGSLAPFPQVIQ